MSSRPAFPGRSSRLLLATIVTVAAVLVLAAWAGAIVAATTQRWEELRQAEANGKNIALSFESQVHRELLGVDQALRILKQERERDPLGFNLADWQRRLVDPADLTTQFMVLDVRGVVVGAVRRELLGANLAGSAFFETQRQTDTGGPYIGWPARGTAPSQWSILLSRRLNATDGAFAGVVAASYNMAALTRSLARSEIGPRDLMLLLGRDGVVRTLLADGVREPGANLSGSPLVAAALAGGASWTGTSPTDGLTRLHIIRQVPGSDLFVVFGLDQAETLRSADTWRRSAFAAASAITLLVIGLAVLLIFAIRQGQRREARLSEDGAILARANADTEAARSQEAARRAQLQAMLSSMSDGMSMLDADLRLVQWNDRFADSVGIPRDMLYVGLPMEQILRAQARAGEFGPMATEADLEEEVQRRMASLRAGSRVGVMERARPDGRVLELRRSVLPSGGFVTLYSDITPRKQVEEAHRRAREVAEATAEEKSRFVAIVSHEIRTPLNVTLNALGLLEQSDLTPAQRRLTGMALQAGDALRGLLNDILDLSRMEVGRLALRPSEFALRALLESVVEMFRGPAAERGVQLALDVAPGVPDRMVTDPARLRQVLMNLVSNATKFADPGRTALEVHTELQRGRAVLRLAVRDPGPPIPEADRARLFRPFSQLDKGGTASGGAGLGLAICQVLTSLLGGRIGCNATPDGGKEFWLTLALDQGARPLVQAPAPALRVAAARRRPPRTRILLVEDIPANQMVVATMLRREGHSVDIASSGEAGVEASMLRPYDIVFMDIHMPGMNGIEAARRVRALPGAAASVPIVALTANVSTTERRSCAEAGMNDVLSKPVEREAMREMLGRMVWALGPVRAAPAPIAPPAPAPAAPAPAAKPRGVEQAVLDRRRVASLRDELPPGVFTALVESCLSDLRERLPRLEQALDSGACPAIEAVSHAMAGVASSYGLARLSERLRLVLNAARASDPAAATDAARDLADELLAAEDAVRALVTAETV